MTALYEYLVKHLEEMLEQTEALVRRESPSSNKPLVDACGQHLAALFRSELGVEPAFIPQSEYGDHLVVKVGNGKKKVLVLGHFDTVWDSGILSYRVENGCAYGPGILDMKAGIIQGLWAMKALHACGFNPDIEVTFLLTTDEELGSPTSKSVIEVLAQQSDVAFVLEPSVGKSGAIKTARKGTAMYRIEAHGIAAHAGNHPEDGASAIHELCQQVTKIIEFHDNVPGTTINVGTIQGGSRTNVVADRAAIQVDVRFTDPKEPERLNRAFYALSATDSRISLNVSGGVNRPPLNPSAESQRIYGIAQNIAQNSLGFELAQASVGGGSDGNFTAALGIPTLDGLGALGDGPHAEHEHIRIEGLPERAALFAHILVEL